MKEINSNAEALKRNFLDLTELKHILRKTQSFFEEVLHMCYDPTTVHCVSKRRTFFSFLEWFSQKLTDSGNIWYTEIYYIQYMPMIIYSFSFIHFD